MNPLSNPPFKQNRLAIKVLFSLFILISTTLSDILPINTVKADDKDFSCDKLGWFPTEFGLKDHSVFWHVGYYYIVSIYLPGEKKFAYARSVDFCTWEELNPVLVERKAGTWDEMSIWAPFVLYDSGTYYMYYTGVTKDFTQSIMLATSDNPADPGSWTTQDMILQPQHPNMVWKNGSWANFRDATVIKLDGKFLMYYTGLDKDGPIIGLATATSPEGPWEDMGAILTRPPNIGILESPTITEYAGSYYLIYNDTYYGEVYRSSSTPIGPWSEAQRLIPGWAHEFWKDPGGKYYTSFLTDYTVTISPITWSSHTQPARPFIGDQVFLLSIPFITR